MSAVLIEFLFPLGDGVDDGGLRLHIAGYRPAARLGAGRHRSRRDRRDVWVNRELQQMKWHITQVIKEDSDAAVVRDVRTALIERGWSGRL